VIGREGNLLAAICTVLAVNAVTASDAQGHAASLRHSWQTQVGGARAGDRSGEGLASGADVNGDGRPDVIVGASGSDRAGRNSGSVYVVFGRRWRRKIDLGDLGRRGFRIDGADTGDLTGLDVANGGDVNADGLEDVIVGAFRADNNGRNSGSAYVVFGKRTKATIKLGRLGHHGFRIDGPGARANAGVAVGGVDDMNGDGLDDVVVGAITSPKGRADAGAAYVVYGKRSRRTVKLEALGTHGYEIDGATAGDQAGLSVTGAGDVNDDDRPDVLIGAPYASYNERFGSGSAYVVFGESNAEDVDLASLGSQGFRMDGSSAPSCGMCLSVRAGFAVAGAGDVNSDGLDDVIVAEPGAHDSGLEDSGSVYVVFGRTLATRVDLAALGSQAFRIDGPKAGFEVGKTVAGGGDVTGDERPDVLLATDLADNNGRNSGSAYVVRGQADTATVSLASLAGHGFRVDGVRRGDSAGIVSPAGDVNHDGLQDVIVGAPFHEYRRRLDAGSAYVVLGR
jgi:hypothetical protein